MIKHLISRNFSVLFKLTVFALALTGAAQMPIFKRYYIASLPGLGWLSDFYLTNKLHYVFAALLLGMLAYLATLYLGVLAKQYRLTLSGRIKSLLFIAVAATGILRVIKNLDSVTLNPLTVMLVDWFHLGFSVFLGLVALFALLAGKKEYLKRKTSLLDR